VSAAAILPRLAWVELKLLVREPLTAIFALAFPLITLFVLAEVFGNEADTSAEDGMIVYRGVGALDYYIPAYLALVIAAIGVVSLPAHLAAYRERGVLRRFRASGLPTWALLGSQLLVVLVLAVASGIVLVVAASLVYETRAPESPLGAALALLLVTAAFASLGLLLGAVLPTARAAQGAGLILFFVMMMISGAGPPPEVLSEPLRRVADVLPLTHAITVVQDPWLGFGWSGRALAAVAGFLCVSLLLAARLFRTR
jgi:ABC-2 type transport system permease protein